AEMTTALTLAPCANTGTAPAITTTNMAMTNDLIMLDIERPYAAKRSRIGRSSIAAHVTQHARRRRTRTRRTRADSQTRGTRAPSEAPPVDGSLARRDRRCRQEKWAGGAS